MIASPEDRKRRKEEQEKKLRLANAAFRQDVARVSATPEGISFIRQIMEKCGYQKISIVGDPTTGDIYDRGTLYNEARRNLYLEIRQYIPLKYRRIIENGIPKK